MDKELLTRSSKHDLMCVYEYLTEKIDILKDRAAREGWIGLMGKIKMLEINTHQHILQSILEEISNRKKNIIININVHVTL
jgi:hypothetical protein